MRTLIVDDHQTFADLLSLALSSEPDMESVGTAGSAAEAVSMAAELKPDLVVMDIEMPHQDGLVATRRLREVLPDVVIVVVTAHRDPQWVLRATQAGASAFVPKNGSLPEMLDVIRRAPGDGLGLVVGYYSLTLPSPSIPRWSPTTPPTPSRATCRPAGRRATRPGPSRSPRSASRMLLRST